MRNALVVFLLAPATLALTPLRSSLAQATPDTGRARPDSTAKLETVTVSAIRAHNQAPISSKSLTAPEIERRYFGQDVPLVLQGTPSLTSYAETGNYWGYSYIRLRGIDQSRINLTLDGIPLNDPEDQVLYFTDFPDLTNSINSIQIQRGVGTSAPGTASYGGSINFETTPLLAARRSGELQLQGGSFGSRRGSVEYSSGTTTSGLSVYGRLTALQSAGYRRHSGTEGRSGFVSAAYTNERSLVKFIATAGLFADTMAYIGATPAELAVDRRANLLRRDEVDRFGEQLAALSYTRLLSPHATASATAYRISAAGNYDVCIQNCDQPVGDNWNFHLDFVWYGVTSVWSYDRDRVHMDAGVNANNYSRDHYAYDRPDFTTALYRNTGRKGDAAAFVKGAYDIGRLTLFADLQGRRAEFKYVPDPNSGVTRAPISWAFLNPKAGVTVHVRPTTELYASVGFNGREPARSDMLAGFDNLDTSNDAFVGSLENVRAEHVRDIEAGVRFGGDRVSANANLFSMQFRDEILPIGQLSYIGTPLRQNVRSSMRRGVEADVTVRPLDRVTLGLNATVMDASIADYTDANSGQSYHNVAPLLTPRFTSSQQVSVALSGAVRATAWGSYYSRAQLNNTGDPTLTLPDYYLLNGAIDWRVRSHTFTLHVNNATGAKKYGSGHVSGGEARYYVLPPINVFLLAKLGV